MKHKGDEDNMITKLRKSAHTSDLLGARGAGSLARGAADEIDRLRAEVKHWEDKEAHEGMSCYVDNKELDRLRALVKEAYIEGFKTAIIHGGYMDLTAYDASDAKAALDT